MRNEKKHEHSTRWGIAKSDREYEHVTENGGVTAVRHRSTGRVYSLQAWREFLFPHVFAGAR